MVMTMLILNRKVGESIIIDDNVEITVLETQDGRIKLGIDAPKEIVVLRKEIYDLVLEENKKSVEQDSNTDIMVLLKKNKK